MQVLMRSCQKLERQTREKKKIREKLLSRIKNVNLPHEILQHSSAFQATTSRKRSNTHQTTFATAFSCHSKLPSIQLTKNLNNKYFHLPEGCAKLKLEDEDVVVLLPKTDPCPNPEFCPNDVDVLDPNKPAPVLLGVLALPEPKEKDERAELAVGAPKRTPVEAVVVLLVLAPNADWLKEKPLAVPLLPLLLLPKLLV